MKETIHKMKLNQLLINSKLIKEAHDKSCLMAVVTSKDLIQRIEEYSKYNIPDEVLYNDDSGDKGREDEFHITVLYGIETNNGDEVINEIKGQELLQKPLKVKLGLVTKFEQDEYDVLKIDIEDYEELEELFDYIDKNVQNSNEYDVYHPHITLAYVEKGECNELVGDDYFKGETLELDRIKFSPAEGEKLFFNLGEEKLGKDIDKISITHTPGIALWLRPDGTTIKVDKKQHHINIIERDEEFLDNSDAFYHGWVAIRIYNNEINFSYDEQSVNINLIQNWIDNNIEKIKGKSLVIDDTGEYSGGIIIPSYLFVGNNYDLQKTLKIKRRVASKEPLLKVPEHQTLQAFEPEKTDITNEDELSGYPKSKNKTARKQYILSLKSSTELRNAIKLIKSMKYTDYLYKVKDNDLVFQYEEDRDDVKKLLQKNKITSIEKQAVRLITDENDAFNTLDKLISKSDSKYRDRLIRQFIRREVEYPIVPGELYRKYTSQSLETTAYRDSDYGIGYWLSPTGESIRLNNEHHDDFAFKKLKELGVLKTKEKRDYRIADLEYSGMLLHEGWARIAVTDKYITIHYEQDLIVPTIQIFLDNIYKGQSLIIDKVNIDDEGLVYDSTSSFYDKDDYYEAKMQLTKLSAFQTLDTVITIDNNNYGIELSTDGETYFNYYLYDLETGKKVGELETEPTDDPDIYKIFNIEVNEDLRRKGLATELYNRVKQDLKHHNIELVHNKTRYPDGEAWFQSLPGRQKQAIKRAGYGYMTPTEIEEIKQSLIQILVRVPNRYELQTMYTWQEVRDWLEKNS